MPRHHGTRKEAIMQMSDYALAQLANERLAHAREVAARRALVRSLPRRESLPIRLGGVLVALGRRLRGLILDALIAHAQRRGHRSMIARVTAENEASLHLHEHHGFVRVGREREVAFKLGRWLDVLTLQRLL